MATKYFCDYCGKEMGAPGTPVIIKLLVPRSKEEDKVKVYHELCSPCIGHFKEQFEAFIAGLGDTCT